MSPDATQPDVEDFAGIYAAYLAGLSGNSFGMFVFLKGNITGADAGGAVYSGHYRLTQDGMHVEGQVVMTAPANGPLITGAVAGPSPVHMTIPIRFPIAFGDDEVFRIETPTGPVNAKLRKLTSLS